MAIQSHKQMSNFIWSICNLLRGPYKRNEYRKVIPPLTVLRRFDCILLPSKQKVLDEFAKIKGKSETIIQARLRKITLVPFYNLSKLGTKKKVVVSKIRHFYKYESPRELEEIEADIKGLETEIVKMLKEVTA